MKKDELLASLRSRIPELQCSEETNLNGGFTILANEISSNNDNAENCSCVSNAECYQNGTCNENSDCRGNKSCSNNTGCKNNGSCHKQHNGTKTNGHIGETLLTYGTML